jgi:hypothetical protein
MSFEQSVHGTRRWSLRNFAQRYWSAYIVGALHPNAILSFEIIRKKSVYRNRWSKEERRWTQEKHLFFHCYLQGILLFKLFLYICGIYNGTAALHTCCLDVSRVAGAWRECDSNQQQATQPHWNSDIVISEFDHTSNLKTFSFASLHFGSWAILHWMVYMSPADCVFAIRVYTGC